MKIRLYFNSDKGEIGFNDYEGQIPSIGDHVKLITKESESIDGIVRLIKWTFLVLNLENPSLNKRPMVQVFVENFK